MKRAATVAALVLIAMATAAAGNVIDRLVAVVNKSPILASDVEDEVRFGAFADGRAMSAIGAADRAAALDRLIEQTLIEQQIKSTNYVAASEADVAAAVKRLRDQAAPGASDEAWRAQLARYRLKDGDVAARVRRQVNELRFIELRFRPSVEVSAGDVEQYYRGEFLPRLHAAGATDKPLNEVRAQIEELLAEQRLNTQLASWLQTLRAQARITVNRPAEEATRPATPAVAGRVDPQP